MPAIMKMILALVACILLVCSPADGAPFYIRGKVTNTARIPVQNVLVTAWDNDAPYGAQQIGAAAQTNAEGKYQITYQKREWDAKAGTASSVYPDVFVKFKRPGSTITVRSNGTINNWNPVYPLNIDGVV